MKYRAKPIVVEAVQWTGKNIEEIQKFVGDSLEYYAWDFDGWEAIHLKIHGVIKVNKNDYIVKGLDGEFFTLTPSVFKRTYTEEK